MIRGEVGVLAKTYKSIAGNLESLIGYQETADELLVLCLHSTPRDCMDRFRRIVGMILKRYKPLHPGELKNYFDGAMSSGPYVIFTFDDGLKNQLHAARILEEFGLRAFFFIVPAFIESIDSTQYYLQHIRRKVDYRVDHELEDIASMSIEELRSLVSRGHYLGSHTYTHLLRKETVQEGLHKEIIESKLWITNMFSCECSSFCSPIRSSISVGASAAVMISQHYNFHFTTFPGLHTRFKNRQCIFRRNIEVFWDYGSINYALGHLDLSRWQQEIGDYLKISQLL